jgi:hypothetical protein
MGRAGFEPATPCLKGRCSNQTELTAHQGLNPYTKYIRRGALCQPCDTGFKNLRFGDQLSAAFTARTLATADSMKDVLASV